MKFRLSAFLLAALSLLCALTLDQRPERATAVMSPFVAPSTGWVTQEFGGCPTDGQCHAAIDIAGPPTLPGAPVYAMAEGVVVRRIQQNNGYGCHIVIDHGNSGGGNNLYSLYSHLGWKDGQGVTQGCYFDVELNQPVAQGQLIGRQGNSGLATGTHVHFATFLYPPPFSGSHHAIDPRECIGYAASYTALTPGPGCSYPDGTLVKGSGSSIYVMSNSVRRHVPNAFTFGVRGYDWAKVIVISDTILAALPLGNPLPNAAADGNLYLGGSGTVWAMQNGMRRPVASPAVMDACTYRWDAIKAVPDALLSGVPIGSTLSSPPCPEWTVREGSLIQAEGTTALYVVRNGIKRHVPNVLSFNGLGLKWGDLDILPAARVQSLPTGNPLMNLKATGVLVSGSGSAVYVMDEGRKRHIVSAGVFEDCGYAWDAIFASDNASVSALPSGTPMSSGPCPAYRPPDDAVFTTGSSTIYVSSAGVRRAIPNVPTFNGRGFQWGNVDDLHPLYASALAPGRPVLDILTDGQLLRSSGTAVYVMEDRAKRHIHSPGVLSGCGYSWDSIVALGDEISSIPPGSSLTSPPCPNFGAPDGTLIQGSGTAVYVVEGGRRRHVANVAVMAACGYQWGNIDQLPDGHIASIPTGPVVSGAPCP
jgi:hypothetical protein